jgi:uncharacterized protein with von Willebrand factor type A (vWA) domain
MLLNYNITNSINVNEIDSRLLIDAIESKSIFSFIQEMEELCSSIVNEKEQFQSYDYNNSIYYEIMSGFRYPQSAFGYKQRNRISSTIIKRK